MNALLQMQRVLGTKTLLQLRKARAEGWEQFISPHFSTRIITTFFNIGLMDEMRKKGTVDFLAFAKERELDGPLLVALGEDLHARRIVVQKGPSTFTLDDTGKFFAEEPMIRGWFELTYGYENVLYHLEDLVRKKMTYGKDIVRDGRYVATGSGFASMRFYFPFVIDMLKNAGYKRVLDIGCGDGTFLRLLHEAEPSIEGVGIDLSPDAVRQGNAQLKEAGLSDKIKLHVGNALKLEESLEHLKGVDAATIFFVLHEFCDQKENKGAIAFCEAFRRALPGVPFNIIETIRPTADEMRSQPGPAVEYFVFHDISGQKPIDRDEWKKVFANAGYSSIEEKYLDFARTSVFTIK